MKDEFSFRESPEVAEIMGEAEIENRSRQLSRKSTVLSALRYTSRGSSSSSSSYSNSHSCSKFWETENEDTVRLIICLETIILNLNKNIVLTNNRMHIRYVTNKYIFIFN